MSKNRSSVKHAEHNLIALRHKERISRDIAFEAGAKLEVEERSIFISENGTQKLLCSVEDSTDLWSLALELLCRSYPHLARQS